VITIAVDAMGGDHGLAVTVPATLAALRRFPDIRLLMVGPRDDLAERLPEHDPSAGGRLEVRHASEVVAMDESPAHALRSKKNSSMRVAIDLVKEGEAQACVSAGNTGALMATARFVLRTLPGIDRPAIIGAVPTMRGHVHVLDLGANVDSTPELLLQFGVMGSILVRCLENRDQPRVALLNIGVEDMKGNDSIRRAAQLMRNSQLNYQGYIEGDSIYTGDMDVIVCDGLVGNVAIKTSEGLAQMIAHILREEFQRDPIRRLCGLFALPVLRALRRRVDHRRYNGATLVGLQGTVIKSHGSADAVGFEHAIAAAVAEVRNGVPERIGRELEPMMNLDRTA